MLYQIVDPINMSINANSFKNAIKHFVQTNQEFNISQFIIHDQFKEYRKANVNFYNDNNKRKIAMSLYPITWPYSPSITYDTKEYPSTTFINNDFIPKIIPLNYNLQYSYPNLLTPLSSIVLPNLAGSVINYAP